MNVDVLANDSDSDGTLVPSTLRVVTPPATGTATVVDGKIAYTPAPNASGAVTLTYEICDNGGACATATVTITVVAVNDPPVANNDSAATSPGTPVDVDVLANDSDVEGSTLTVSTFSQGANGTVALVAGKLRYTPGVGFTGSDTFTYRAHDGTVDSNLATVTITDGNVAPVAVDDAASTDEDTPVDVNVLANDTDADGDPLSVASFTQPAHGSVALAGAMLRYTPAANFNGTDTFQYRASDATEQSNLAMVTITVNSVSDAPVASDSTETTAEDTPLTSTVSATDGDGDALSYSLVGPAPVGLSFNTANGAFTYTPASNFHGTVSFQFKANDGTTDSNTATVTITVTPVNDRPVALTDAYETNEDTTLNVAASGVLGNDSDVEGTALQAVLQPGGDPLNGVLTLNADGSFSYVPDANFHGTDSFQYRASDGALVSTPPTVVTITVRPINDAPVALDDSKSTDEDTPFSASVSATDVDGDPLSFALVGSAPAGLTFNANGSYTYTPPADFNGTASFQFKANDGTVDSNTATVTITVNPVNDAPVAFDAGRATDEDTTLSSSVPAAVDVDGDSLTYAVVTGLPGLTFNANGTFTYVPPANFNGTKTFTYKANDGSADSNVATITITVNPVNDAPVAANDSAATDQGVAVDVDVLANDADIDGPSLGVGSFSQGANGTVALVAGKLRYTPNAGFHGTDSFTYRATDGIADSNLATVTITVRKPNEAPVAADLSVSTPEDTTLTSSVVATDADSDALTYSETGVHLVGLTLNPNGNFTYTPATNFNGTKTFSFKANDGTADSNVATVTITVTPVNDAPTAANDSAATDQGVAVDIDVLANDADIDGPSLGVGPFGQGGNGTVSLVAGKLRYTPNAGFTGADSFTYRASDGLLTSNLATVTITVRQTTPDPNAQCTINGTGGNDTLSGTPGDDVICGLGGNDRISALGGNDVVKGGPGADTADGGDGNDLILGEAGNDTVLEGGAGDDTIIGGVGHDKLAGTGGNDQLRGEDGRDWLLGGSGNDTLDGGADNDKADYKESSSAVQIDLAAGTAAGEGSDTLSSVEIVVGSPFGDLIDGSDGPDELSGYNGNDTINGRGGNDFIDGGRNTDDCGQGPGTGDVVNCEARQAAGAAATNNASSSFTQPNQLATQTIPVSPASSSFNAILSWEAPGSSFTITAELVQAGSGAFALASADTSDKAKPKKKPKARKPITLRLTVRRGATYMVVRGSVPKKYRKRGAKIRFKLRAVQLAERTTVETTVKQPRR